MKAMRISDLAQAAGVGVETIRLYQRKGLLNDPEASKLGHVPGRRHYGAQDLRRLHFVRAAKIAGFTLREIGELLALDSTEDRSRVRELAQRRIVELDRTIEELVSARKRLSKLAEECAGGGSGPCPIIASFELD